MLTTSSVPWLLLRALWRRGWWWCRATVLRIDVTELEILSTQKCNFQVEYRDVMTKWFSKADWLSFCLHHDFGNKWAFLKTKTTKETVKEPLVKKWSSTPPTLLKSLKSLILLFVSKRRNYLESFIQFLAGYDRRAPSRKNFDFRTLCNSQRRI